MLIRYQLRLTLAAALAASAFDSMLANPHPENPKRCWLRGLAPLAWSLHIDAYLRVYVI